MQKVKMKKYLISFTMNGSNYCEDIMAESVEDAYTRLDAIKATARVDGEHILTIPAIGKGTWLPNFILGWIWYFKGMGRR